MKVVLLLLVSLAGIKCQHKIVWPYAPRIHLIPFLVDESPAAGYVSVDAQDDHKASEDEIRDLYAAFYSQSLGRNKAESKLFQNGFLSNLLGTTLTSTVWSTVLSTLTTIVVSSCIPVSQFSTTVPAAGTTNTLSNVCARRRRSAAEKFLIADLISATPRQTVDVTEVPQAPGAELLSSKEDPPVDPTVDPASVQRRNRALTALKTVTSTMTSFSFASTVILKTVSLATTTQLYCLPSGYRVC